MKDNQTLLCKDNNIQDINHNKINKHKTNMLRDTQ